MEQNAWYRYMIAAVWLVNGLLCKVLGLVPRHEQIVARIPGSTHAHGFTVAIGIAEVLMAFWVLSGWRYRWCATAQIVVILTMNVMEFFVVPDLLLWGRFNALFAVLFMAFIYWTAFGPRKKRDRRPHA